MSLAVAWSAVLAAGAPDPTASVLDYLNRTIDWHREVWALGLKPIDSQDVVLRETSRQNARQVLQLGFAIARAEAQSLDNTPHPTSGPTGGNARNIGAVLASNAQLIAQLQAQLDQLNPQVTKTPPDEAAPLIAKRDKLVAQLNFAKTRQSALQDIQAFMSGLDTSGSAGVLQRISDLEKSIPDLQNNPQSASIQSSAASADAAASDGRPFEAENVGILGLMEELFTLTGRITELGHVSADTQRLLDHNSKLRDPLRAQLQSAIRQGEAISQAAQTDDPAKLASQRQQLDALTTRLKQLTAVTVPLGEQNAVLGATISSLGEWQKVLDRESERLLRSLLFRLAMIAAIIIVLLLISRIWGKIALRYVTDVRRRRQFMLLRRVVVGSIITMVLIASVVAEFGSLATFAGLITAGIAVALQSVILSGCAYFFFIGKYGVRVGDRVTISNITGDVIDIGLFRLYLMELAGNSRDLSPTGRIVVFSNSVLFQPNAFFKQMPGADYVWHEVALTLSPDTDHRAAEERLLGAVESVYNTYRDQIERQYNRVKDSVHLSATTPRPVGRLRLVDAGLEYVIRYPVDIHRAGEIDDAITRKLLVTIEQEPKLKLVPSGTPRIQPAANASPSAKLGAERSEAPEARPDPGLRSAPHPA
ncbi:MAG TPA: mechanosensitive ion channel family protein [Tepidisphaeraceae bacterium]|nr:mechanosensitive ion channel family protein [Tepidisphaeraceae bacterium]